jgi:hypothetical protein
MIRPPNTVIDHGDYTEEIWEPDPPSAGKANGHAAPAANPEPEWPNLGEAAYHGLAGDVVKALLPETEADPAALLLQYLAGFGNAVGRKPHVRRANADHYANIFVLIVGRTARSRKGTSAQDIRNVMQRADPDWLRDCVKGGISSGEGIIEKVRDARFA